MSKLKEFREFAVKGNAIDMAVGIVVGAAFGGIVKSLVDDIIMPPVGLILGNIDFSNLYFLLQDGAKSVAPYASLTDAKSAGAITINYGLFINSIVNFLIVAFSIFIVVRTLNHFKRKKSETNVAPSTKICSFCQSTISAKAIRCAHCTSELTPS